jgi:putative intracellular protease/amidase
MVEQTKRVLVLAADLFEDMELLYPVYRLREEDIGVTIAGLDRAPVTGKKGHGPVDVDVDWVDEATVVDGNLIAARTPADLGPWMKALLAALEAGPS